MHPAGDVAFLDQLFPPPAVLESVAGQVQRPETRLLAAVLARGIEDLQHPDEYVRMDARRWFRAHNHTHCCTFESVCEVLGLSADAIRARLLGSDEHHRHILRRGGPDPHPCVA